MAVLAQLRLSRKRASPGADQPISPVRLPDTDFGQRTVSGQLVERSLTTSRCWWDSSPQPPHGSPQHQLPAAGGSNRTTRSTGTICSTRTTRSTQHLTYVSPHTLQEFCLALPGRPLRRPVPLGRSGIPRPPQKESV
ncbi:hypothetical protein Stube_18520 [Streptomyces tubercidicus]|uniref:Uncharacterized protein n=1 Tax=Streptomyces tubercidicus TaxID=47759 RepID=A0A640UNA5_9ACTN|nr:hypothetical protein Stube_18520 [Streptomyces tubercidicus]